MLKSEDELDGANRHVVAAGNDWALSEWAEHGSLPAIVFAFGYTGFETPEPRAPLPRNENWEIVLKGPAGEWIDEVVTLFQARGGVETIRFHSRQQPYGEDLLKFVEVIKEICQRRQLRPWALLAEMVEASEM